jgi:hypothetical protein
VPSDKSKQYRGCYRVAGRYSGGRLFGSPQRWKTSRDHHSSGRLAGITAMKDLQGSKSTHAVEEDECASEKHLLWPILVGNLR